jgi:hypothetical protein
LYRTAVVVESLPRVVLGGPTGIWVISGRCDRGTGRGSPPRRAGVALWFFLRGHIASIGFDRLALPTFGQASRVVLKLAIFLELGVICGIIEWANGRSGEDIGHIAVVVPQIVDYLLIVHLCRCMLHLMAGDRGL